MIQRCLCLLFFLIGTTCVAEEVEVYSGEHEDFSRLVLRFEKPITWKKEAGPGSFRISFSRDELELDTSRVFEKIPDTRFSAISFDSSKSSLTLKTTANIAVEVFFVDDLTLVIDGRKAPIDHSMSTLNTIFPPEDPFPFGRPVLPDLRSKMPDDLDIELSQVLQESRHGKPSRDTEFDETFRFLHQAMEGSEGMRIEKTKKPDVRSKPLSEYVSSHTLKKESQHLEVFTPWVQRGDGNFNWESTEAKKTKCLDNEQVDISRWFGDRNAASIISESRIFSEIESGRVPDVDVERVVRAYIYLGFGMEAIAILNEYGTSVVNHDLYLEMSYIVEGLGFPGRSVFQEMRSCGGPSSLWAFLIDGQKDSLQEFDYISVQSSLMGLPDHLRTLFGPRVSEKFLELGEHERFEAVHAAVGRGGDSGANGWRLVEGRKLVQLGSYSEGVELFRKSLAGKNDRSTTLMKEILRANRIAGMVNTDDLELAEVVYFEDRLNDQNGELLEELALGWFSVGNFELAWRYWDKVETFPISREIRTEDLSFVVNMFLDKSLDSQLYFFKYNSKRRDYLDLLSGDVFIKLGRWAVDNDEIDWLDDLIKDRGLNDFVPLKELLIQVALGKRDRNLALSMASGQIDTFGSLDALQENQSYSAVTSQKDLANNRGRNNMNFGEIGGGLNGDVSREVSSVVGINRAPIEFEQSDNVLKSAGAGSIEEARNTVSLSEAMVRRVESAMSNLD